MACKVEGSKLSPPEMEVDAEMQGKFCLILGVLLFWRHLHPDHFVHGISQAIELTYNAGTNCNASKAFLV